MHPMKARILTLEAQVNAMAQAFMYLAAHVEMQCGIDMESMESALCQRHWPSNPEIDLEARATLQWLCSEMAEAREVRQARACQ